ncbi:MAG: hypothetical protein ACREEY_00355 [Brevundimonas sp.]
MTARLTIVDATVAIQKDDQLEHTQVAVAFDAITTPAAARTAGRQIGEAMGEALALQLQQRRSLVS